MFSWDVQPGWFDVLGLALTLLGLYLAWRQSKDAKLQAKQAEDQAVLATTAADQAKEAITATEAKLNVNQLQGSLVSIQQTIIDLDHAATNENGEIAKFLLTRYGIYATEAAELMDKHELDAKGLSTKLRETSQAALDAKSALAKTSAPKVAKATGSVREELDRLNLEVTGVMARLRNTPGEPK